MKLEKRDIRLAWFAGAMIAVMAVAWGVMWAYLG